MTGNMRVPVLLFGSEAIMRALDDDAARQIANVARLPGIVDRAMTMPDAHRGYGFPIGGVAAFNAREGGVVSAGGVGFDISCGVRTLRTGLKRNDLLSRQQAIAEALYRIIPSGVGRGGRFHLKQQDLQAMLLGGAQWAVERGMGTPEDLLFCEEQGRVPGAAPQHVSAQALERFTDQLGTLGSGNHYLEIQCVERVYDHHRAAVFGIAEDDVLVSIHCGSRGLGHQIGTDYLKEMAPSKKKGKKGKKTLTLPDRELACAPIDSDLGRRYLGAMAAGCNCALANRQALSHLAREAFDEVFPAAALELLYDVSHNTCKVEEHVVNGQKRRLHVHRKGATRALPPGHPMLPEQYAGAGQPVMIGGSMGTSSYILAGCSGSDEISLASACHGAGRTMGRMQAKRMHKGRDVLDTLAHRGILIMTGSVREVAEEAPEAYKDVDEVIDSTVKAGLAVQVARLAPMVCIKG